LGTRVRPAAMVMALWSTSRRRRLAISTGSTWALEPVEKTPRTAFSMPRSTLSSKPMVLLLSLLLRDSASRGTHSGDAVTTKHRARRKRAPMYPILLATSAKDLNPQRAGNPIRSRFPSGSGGDHRPEPCLRAALRAVATVALPGKNMPQGGCNAPIRNLRGMSVMLDLAAFHEVQNRIPVGRSGRSCARVAERQTRWLQVPVSERAWGFKSPLAHASGPREINDFPGSFLVFAPVGVSRSVSPRRRC
jgi:hypothetical protein